MKTNKKFKGNSISIIDDINQDLNNELRDEYDLKNVDLKPMRR
jgi:hypothetical protein